MNKILTLAFSVMIAGTLFTGCGNNKVTPTPTPASTTTPTPTKIESSTPKELEATKEEVSKQPTENGDKTLTEQEKQIFADSDKVAELIKPITKDFIGALYNITPANFEQSFKTMDSFAYDKNGVFGTQSEEIKDYAKKQTNKLTSFHVRGLETGLETTLKDGNTYSSVNEEIVVTFTQNGKDEKNLVKLTLIYIPSVKTFKIVAISLEDYPVKVQK